MEFNIDNIRRATIDDRNDILALLPEGEYEGDNMPDYFYLLMNNPNYHPFVYIHSGKIIAHGALFIVDGGDLGVPTAGRMPKQYRNKGMLNLFGAFFLQHFPQLKYYSFSTFVNTHLVKQHIKKGKYELLAIKKCVFYEGDYNLLEQLEPKMKKETSDLLILNVESLKDLFRNHHIYPKVFNGRLIVNSVPFTLVDSNVPLIFSRKTRAVISDKNNPNRTLLTFGTHFRLTNGEVFCKLELYGTLSRHRLASHILLHLDAFKIDVKSGFTFECRDDEISEDIEAVMMSCGLKGVPKDKYSHTEAIYVQFTVPKESKL